MAVFGGKGAGRDAATEKALTEAIQLNRAGRLDEAMRALESGGRALKTADGQNVAGDILLKQGKHREAIRAFDGAIKLAPAAPEPHANRGVALQAMGRLEEALAAQDKAIRLRPEYALAHFNRGNVLRDLKRYDDAVAAYGRAVRAQPALAEGFLNRGVVLLSLNRPLEALTDFGRAHTLRPRYAAALVGRANAHRMLGATADALAAADAALALEPANVEAVSAKYFTLFHQERYSEALGLADDLVAGDSDSEIGHGLRAGVLYKLQRYEEALKAADIALAIAPQFHEAHTIRGLVLGELGRMEESLAAIEAARRAGASEAEYFGARGLTLSALGDPGEALANFDKALALQPDDRTTHNNRALLLLGMGEWREGWAEHEWRMKSPSHAHNEFNRLAPQWRGEDLTGKRLLLYAEQGYGDTIQFVRYLGLLNRRGARVRLAAPEPLRRLLGENFPGVEVTDVAGSATDTDYQISLMSLPSVFGSTPETLPRNVPYLRANDEKVAKWRVRLGSDGFRVGIVWQGNPRYGRDRYRSIPLAAFAPLARVPGVRLVSLQTAAGAGQLKTMPDGMKVEELGNEITDNPDGFREVAAVMANLDLLIMSDTGPTHLAGALGRPIWLALTRYADWRWMREREDTPWYPTMRLFRQKTVGDWDTVFERMAAELTVEMAGRTPSA